MPTAFIDDGYTREELILESKRHPAVRIVYRPMLHGERNRVVLRTLQLSEKGERGIEEAARLVAESLARHIVWWDVSDGSGALVPATAENMSRLEPNLFEKVYSAVAGFDDEQESAKN
jgi:hypothetical protein